MKQNGATMEEVALEIAAMPLEIPTSPVVAELATCVDALKAARDERNAFEEQYAHLLEMKAKHDQTVTDAEDRVKSVAKQVLGPGETMQKGPFTLTRVCSYSYDASKVRALGICDDHPSVLKESVDAKVLEALVKTGQVDGEDVAKTKSKAVSDYVKVGSR